MNPSIQVQIPLALSQCPLPLHSTNAWAVSSAEALSEEEEFVWYHKMHQNELKIVADGILENMKGI